MLQALSGFELSLGPTTLSRKRWELIPSRSSVPSERVQLRGAGRYSLQQIGGNPLRLKTTVCSDAASTVAYTQSRYFGPNVSSVFAYAAAACGNSVTRSISYSMDVGFRNNPDLRDCFFSIVDRFN